MGLLFSIIIGATWLFLAQKKRASLYIALPINKKRLVYVSLLIVMFIGMFIPSRRNVEQSTSSNLNLDVYLIVDTSLSMHAEDSKDNKTRMETVKKYFEKSLDELDGARFTVVEFSGTAVVTQPGLYSLFTTKNTLKEARSPLLYDASGSKFSDPLKLTIERIDRSKQNTHLKDIKRTVIIVSDGEQVGADKDFSDSIKSLSKKIDDSLVVGVGTEKGGHMKVAWTHLGGANYDEDKEKYVTTTKNIAGPDAPLSDDNLPLATSKANPNFMSDLSKKLGSSFINLEISSNEDLTNQLNKLKSGTLSSTDGNNKLSETTVNGFYWMISPFCIFLILLIRKPFINTTKIKKVIGNDKNK